MTRAPFYTSPYDFGRTHTDAGEALAVAATLRSDDTTKTPGAHVLRGIAARPDLTDDHVHRLIDLAEPALGSARVALLTNPALRHNATVQDLFTSDLITLFLDRDDVAFYADLILRLAPGPSHWNAPQGNDYYTLIADALGTEAVEDYFNRTCTPTDTDALQENADHPMLTATGFDRIVDAIKTTDDDALALSLFTTLSNRSNLSDAQGLRLVKAATLLARKDPAHGRWLLFPLITNRHCPAAAMTRLVTHRAQSIRDLVLTQGHLTPETIFAATKAHIPYALTRLTTGAIPDDVADVALSDLEAGTARRRTLDAAEVRTFTAALIARATGERVWDRALALYRRGETVNPGTGIGTGVEAFYTAVYASVTDVRTLRPAHPGGPDRFLRWATGHPEADLRAVAVQALVLPPQFHAAATDPAVQVRTAVARHRRCPPEVLTALASDPDTGVRLTVANHRVLDATMLGVLAADADAEVRATVSERFLDAFDLPSTVTSLPPF